MTTPVLIIQLLFQISSILPVPMTRWKSGSCGIEPHTAATSGDQVCFCFFWVFLFGVACIDAKHSSFFWSTIKGDRHRGKLAAESAGSWVLLTTLCRNKYVCSKVLENFMPFTTACCRGPSSTRARCRWKQEAAARGAGTPDATSKGWWTFLHSIKVNGWIKTECSVRVNWKCINQKCPEEVQDRCFKSVAVVRQGCAPGARRCRQE